MFLGSPMWRSGWAIVILATGAAAYASRGLRSHLHKPQAPDLLFIPKTAVPMPVDYEDYTRGRTPWVLFNGTAPGSRYPEDAAAPGLPAFNPASPAELFIDASPTDPVGHNCAPGGDAAGHYFYNIMTPELVPYIVAKNDPKHTGTAVVIAPGGGFIHLAWEAEGISWAEWFNTIGVSAFVLKYRVPNNVGDLQLMDAQRAMSLVRSKADQYGINPTRIGFVGSSAGGGVALALQRATERAYDPRDAIDYLPSKPDFLVLQYSGGGDEDVAPENMRNFPPTAYGFAEDDPCCKSAGSHVFKSALEAYATSSVLIQGFSEGGHGWGSCDYYPQLRGMDVCTWKDKVKTWLMDNDLL